MIFPLTSAVLLYLITLISESYIINNNDALKNYCDNQILCIEFIILQKVQSGDLTLRYTALAFQIHSGESNIIALVTCRCTLRILCCQMLCHRIDGNLILDSKLGQYARDHTALYHLCVPIIHVGVNSLKNALLNKI